MSTQLPRDRPLWQICVADRLDDGRIGVVGKAHHCMVDGLAAVELATLLLDPSPNPDPAEPDGWRAKPAAGWVWRLAEGLSDRLREQATLLQLPARVMRSPARLPAQARSVGLALVRAVRPAKPVYPLNQPISPARHLASFWRPFEDLKRIAREFGVTVNDVLLAISTGGIRRWLQDRGRGAEPLKAMVPVSVRPDGAAEELGNRISFVFVDLPCDEPDAVRRLTEVRAAMSERKRSGDPEGAQAVLEAVKLAPRSVRRTVSRLVASPRTFNLVVSNIPGPREPMYMLGCELQEAYPVVPIADEHALSIGMTTVGERACFGLYTDRESLPDSDRLAAEMEAAIDELLTRA
jgi:WS/DGAT/MGAT family acyltransferase